MPERVPTELFLNSGSERDGTNVPAQNRLTPNRLPATVPSAWKNPIVWFVVTTDLFPFTELRLVAARERMLIEGLDAASAAFEVGYESPSQFNREYKRFFGQPPMRDIKTRRFWSLRHFAIDECHGVSFKVAANSKPLHREQSQSRRSSSGAKLPMTDSCLLALLCAKICTFCGTIEVTAQPSGFGL